LRVEEGRKEDTVSKRRESKEKQMKENQMKGEKGLERNRSRGKEGRDKKYIHRITTSDRRGEITIASNRGDTVCYA